MRECYLTAFLSLVVVLAFIASLSGQTTQAPSDEQAQDESIPVTSPLVRQACGSCHRSDAQGRMTRISYQRTTPEGWQQTIRRMVLLNNLQIEATDAREVVRYLANHHGLAPEEAQPAAFEAERRLIDYHYAPDRVTEETCTKCHSMGRVISQRRTREEWKLLTTMHRGYYPLTDNQAFRRRGRAEAGPDGEVDPRHPVEKAVDHLAAAFPLNTPEWSAWSATMRSPRLEGKWALAGQQLGKGPIYGELVVTAKAGAPDEFETDVRYVYARTGDSVTRTGQAVVYTGFQWRGRSFEVAENEGLREVLFVERNQQAMSGRWFTGAYDEIGLDVTLRRVRSEPIVLGVHPQAVRVAASGVTLRIYGANLPDTLTPTDIDLGPGIETTGVTQLTSSGVTVQVAVAPEAVIGARDVFIGSSMLARAVVVYDEVQRISVSPATGLARVGGVVFPKQYQSFEARAYHDGPDAEPNTTDDLDLGLVNATWSLEEYAATFGDDDTSFVGWIDANGLFSPAKDGPNPERRNSANNIGDVWVVATLPEPSTSKVLRARAHLLVTVPGYLRRGLSEEVR